MVCLFSNSVIESVQNYNISLITLPFVAWIVVNLKQISYPKNNLKPHLDVNMGQNKC